MITKEQRLKIAKEHAISKGGECISTEYNCSREYLIWKCKNSDHDSWQATYTNVLDHDRWCPECIGLLSPKKRLIKAQNYAISRSFVSSKFSKRKRRLMPFY